MRLANLKKYCTLDTQQHLILQMVQCSSTYLPLDVVFLCINFCPLFSVRHTADRLILSAQLTLVP
jgi:hypothetical protein